VQLGRRPLAAVLLALLCRDARVFAHTHHHREGAAAPAQVTTRPPRTIDTGAKGVSGTGAFRFRVLLTAAALPDEARRVLVSAHGGFAVDHRAGKEETYFALPGAGILRLGADLKQVALVPTAPEMKDTNLHNTKIWYAPDGTPFLSFPANDGGRVFTTSLAGELLNTLARPADSDDFGLPSVRDYFAGGGAFVPTEVVAALDGPDRSKGAPIYLLEDDRLVSTIFPKDDLGLVNFKHVHNAVLREAGGRLYIIAQSWNPGDFAVLEQVVP